MKSDSAIQSDVIHELKSDPSVIHEHLGVAVSNGIVTLTGIVPTFFEKSAAENAAQRVGGVTAVVEKIEIKPAGSYTRDDHDIAAAIINRFKWHSQILEEKVHVKVEDGWVTLTGECDWNDQRAAAEDVIRRLLGVKGISNRITIKARVAQPVDIKRRSSLP